MVYKYTNRSEKKNIKLAEMEKKKHFVKIIYQQIFLLFLNLSAFLGQNKFDK